jgi:hypothetical protein
MKLHEMVTRIERLERYLPKAKDDLIKHGQYEELVESHYKNLKRILLRGENV